MTIGEFITAAVLSVAAIWLWSQVAGFFLIAAVAAARAYWRTRIEQREEIERAVERVKAEYREKWEAAKADSTINGRCSTFQAMGVSPLPWSVGFRDPFRGTSPLSALQREVNEPQRRKQLVERLALDVGEDEPVFCSWPAGRQTITLPTRGGDPMILVRTNECILDDGTDRLAVVYRVKPE